MRQCAAIIVALVFCCVSLGLAEDYREIILFEDFEEDEGGFTGSLDWEWGSFAWSGSSCGGDNFPPATAYSGTSMWGTILDDCYNNLGNNEGYDTCINGNPDDDSILSFDVDLTGYTEVTLSFYEWFDVFLQWDWAEITVNGTVVMQHCGSSFVEPTAWEEQIIDLTPYGGEVVTIEFHLLTSSVVNHAGWYIDDVRVFSPDPSTPTPTSPPCIHHGDVNLDDDITAADAQMAFQIALGIVIPTYEEACAADCNGDEIVTAGDAQQIFLVVLGSGMCVDPLS
ncbi:hypothetical protein K8T06_07050 [bacterium]|nr:hypothetical protein [bacterium]